MTPFLTAPVPLYAWIFSGKRSPGVVDVMNDPSLTSSLEDFSKEGLRTLVLGIRELSKQECDEWLQRYNQVSLAFCTPSPCFPVGRPRTPCSFV